MCVCVCVCVVCVCVCVCVWLCACVCVYVWIYIQFYNFITMSTQWHITKITVKLFKQYYNWNSYFTEYCFQNPQKISLHHKLGFTFFLNEERKWKLKMKMIYFVVTNIIPQMMWVNLPWTWNISLNWVRCHCLWIKVWHHNTHPMMQTPSPTHK